MSARPTTCVIGAGSSGLTTLKALTERGVPAEAYEASDRIGGNWVFGNKNAMSASYTTLHINTSRERMEYSDFPMPKSYPDFPHHSQIAEYFDAYADHFGLREHIRFETRVERAEKLPEGGWRITTDRGDERRYDALVVANGHHWNPRWPEPAFPGSDTFEGEQMHAHAYTDPEQLAGKRVVVLGMGNSAMDIAVDASYHASEVFLAARRGAYIFPKYLFGKPADQLRNDPRVPFAIRRTVIEKLVTAAIGRPEDYGLPKPDHRFGEAHPTVSGRILDRIAHGTITPKPNIARLDGRDVHFDDGSVARDVDLVVYCTGYKITFPFFDGAFLAAPDNVIRLFRRVFHPDHDDLAFIGLLQPLGAIMPLAEAQGRWVARYLLGEYALPSPDEMRADIERDWTAMQKRYVSSKRHTIQVDFEDYLHDLGKELKAGAARARARGFRPPLAARAAGEAAAVA